MPANTRHVVIRYFDSFDVQELECPVLCNGWYWRRVGTTTWIGPFSTECDAEDSYLGKKSYISDGV